MPHKPPVLPGHTYHIYNRGNNSIPIFLSDESYLYFIKLMKIYLVPVADIYSYALMRNHLHIALRIKEDEEIGWLSSLNVNNTDLAIKWMTTPEKLSHADRKPAPLRMIQHLFSAYTKWLNAKHLHTGNLMEDRFERKIVDSEDQLRTLICYINLNPEKHGICGHKEYPWTSYRQLTSDEMTWLAREDVFELFGSKGMFTVALERKEFDEWLESREFG